MLPGYVLVQDNCEPQPLKATFDGWTKKLAYFLNQVWNYLDLYGADFHDEGAIANAITMNLEKEAEWVVALHNEGDLELGDVDAFLEGLQARFGDPTQAH